MLCIKKLKLSNFNLAKKASVYTGAFFCLKFVKIHLLLVLVGNYSDYSGFVNRIARIYSAN